MRMFRDFENDVVLTEGDLQMEFDELKANNDTDSQTLDEYILNCTSKNGTLEEIF